MRLQLAGACLALLVMACKSTDRPARVAGVGPESNLVRSIAYRGNGDLAAIVETPGGCILREVAARDSSARSREVPSSIDCGSARLLTVGSSVVVSDERSAAWLEESRIALSPAVLAAVARDNFIERTNHQTTAWRTADRTIPLAPSLSAPQIFLDGSAVVAIETNASGSRLVRINRAGEHLSLTPYFPAMESFALDPKGKEIAFSARRDTFDIGIVSTSGSDVNWVGPDASDEIEVTWAPRGNKITYVVKQFGGTTFRTVHIPTGYQVAADFADMHAQKVAWEPQAERFAVIVSSPLATDHVQTIRYGGEDRRTLIAPAASSRGTIESLLIAGVPAVLVTPRSVRYGHRYPLIIYKSSTPLAWHPLSVLHEEGAGIVVVPSRVILNGEFWQELTKLAWVDPERRVMAFGGKNDMIPNGTPAFGTTLQANDASAARSAVSFARKRIAESAPD